MYEHVYIVVLVSFSWLGSVAVLWWFFRFRSLNIKSLNYNLEQKLAAADANLVAYREQIQNLREGKVHMEAQLVHAKEGIENQRRIFEDCEARMKANFSDLASAALRDSNQAFLSMTEKVFNHQREQVDMQGQKAEHNLLGLVKPIRESLDKVDVKILELEKTRIGAYQGLKEQIDMLMQTQGAWQLEATKLSAALGSPTVRGRWGELQLRRVVEIAGMVAHCDFYEQVVAKDLDGKSLRPDMLVKLPGGKSIVVDSKAPMSSYLEAQEAQSRDQEAAALKQFTQSVKRHIQDLSSKSYWRHFDGSPEFVVLFLPNESCFEAALRVEPALIEFGTKNSVILATPTSLISLLKTAHYGWKQESIADNAREVSNLGRELHGRLADFVVHVLDVGKGIKGAVSSYNKMIGTLESRVLVSARRFVDLKVDDPRKSIKAPASLESEMRGLRSHSAVIGKPSMPPEDLV